MMRGQDLRHLHLGCGEALRSRLLTWVAPRPGALRREWTQRPLGTRPGRLRG